MQSPIAAIPPELIHITQGFIPFTHVLHRSCQQCWNDLNYAISDLVDGTIGSLTGKRAPTQKRLRIMELAQQKRIEFIKLLVLSQWSRRATEIGKLIDIQAYIHMCYDSYNSSIFLMGELKRDLIRAQLGNPDLTTALDLLSYPRPTFDGEVHPH